MLRRRRVGLSAQRQQLLEHDLGGDADELHELRVGLLVGFVGVGIIARGARDFGEIPDDFADLAVERLERSEIWPVPSPYRKPVHQRASAFARPLRGCSSSGSSGSNSMPCSPNEVAVAVNTRSSMAADSSESDAPSGSISLIQSCILYGAIEQSAPHREPWASAASAMLPAAASTSSKS